MTKDRRFYTRYSLLCECIVVFESSLKFKDKIQDISAESAKLRVYSPVFIKLGGYYLPKYQVTSISSASIKSK